MDYQKTWEVMNDLETSFNQIVTIETLVNDLEASVNAQDLEEIKTITKALVHYLPVYLNQYDKASKRAWNNTVLKVAETDVPYRDKISFTEDQSPITFRDNLYKEVVKFYEEN